MKSIECPVLLLFAEYDINVDPQENIDHLNQIFDGQVPDNFSVKTMPKGQHGFYKVENRCVPWEEAEKNDFDSNFQSQISEWVRGLN